MLSGRYPSDEFAELRPRIVWDRLTGTLTGRPGAQRLAVTSGGTIPDRGLFGVFLAGREHRRAARRVGELDEEMVYESRVGRRVHPGRHLVADRGDHPRPGPGHPRPGPAGPAAVLARRRPRPPGRAGRRPSAASCRELSAADDTQPPMPGPRAAGLDDWAADNLLAYLREQQRATNRVPDDRNRSWWNGSATSWATGGWSLHSPYGAQVHAPWALAIAARLRERFGVDAQAMPARRRDRAAAARHRDRGRRPARRRRADRGRAGRGRGHGHRRSWAGRRCSQPGSGSAPARALLLPRRRPGQRQPLWQQRQRAAQLLEVAARYASFPIVLETVRECLQDVFDVPALVGTACATWPARRVRVVEVATVEPSPFARSLLFGYVGAVPVRGRLAAGRAPGGRAGARLRPCSPSCSAGARAPRCATCSTRPSSSAPRPSCSGSPQPDGCVGAEGVADLLRLLGPLTVDDLARRTRPRPGTASRPNRPRSASTRSRAGSPSWRQAGG